MVVLVNEWMNSFHLWFIKRANFLTDRIDVGIMNLNEARRLHNSIFSEYIEYQGSTYLILTPRSSSLSNNSNVLIYSYGKERGEALNFQRLETFLKFRLPERRDVFRISLTLVNLLLCIDLFLVDKSCCIKHVMSWLWRVVFYNSILVVLCFTTVTLLQCNFKWLNWLADQVVIILVQGLLCNSFLGHLLVAQWSFISSLSILTILVFIFGCGVGLFSWNCVGPPLQTTPTNTDRIRRMSQIRIDSSAALAILPIESSPSLYLRHRTRLSWIGRGNPSVILINQLLWPIQASQRPMRYQLYNDHCFTYCHAKDINNLPKWRFAYDDTTINSRLIELGEGKFYCYDPF